MTAIPAKLAGRPDPYTVVIIEGVQLPTYAAGGVNASVGELAVVDHASVYRHRASAGIPTQFDVFVSSGSGNVVTISAYTGSGTEAGAVSLGGAAYAIAAYGH